MPGRRFLLLGRCGPDEKQQTLTVRSRSGTPFTVTQAQLDAAGAHVGEPSLSAAGDWQVTVSADAPGILDAKLLLTTDVPGEEAAAVPVYAHVIHAD